MRLSFIGASSFSELRKRMAGEELSLLTANLNVSGSAWEICAMSRKQKLNTKSSTTAELVCADDATTMMLWTKLFMEEQGYKIEENVLYQDNKTAICGRRMEEKA